MRLGWFVFACAWVGLAYGLTPSNLPTSAPSLVEFTATPSPVASDNFAVASRSSKKKRGISMATASTLAACSVLAGALALCLLTAVLQGRESEAATKSFNRVAPADSAKTKLAEIKDPPSPPTTKQIASPPSPPSPPFAVAAACPSSSPRRRTSDDSSMETAGACVSFKNGTTGSRHRPPGADGDDGDDDDGPEAGGGASIAGASAADDGGDGEDEEDAVKSISGGSFFAGASVADDGDDEDNAGSPIGDGSYFAAAALAGKQPADATTAPAAAPSALLVETLSRSGSQISLLRGGSQSSLFAASSVSPSSRERPTRPAPSRLTLPPLPSPSAVLSPSAVSPMVRRVSSASEENALDSLAETKPADQAASDDAERRAPSPIDIVQQGSTEPQ